jgi:hypothetical protein
VAFASGVWERESRKAGTEARPTIFRDREVAGRPVGVDPRLEACATEEQEQSGGYGRKQKTENRKLKTEPKTENRKPNNFFFGGA